MCKFILAAVVISASLIGCETTPVTPEQRPEQAPISKSEQTAEQASEPEPEQAAEQAPERAPAMPTVDPQSEEQRQAELEKWQSAIRARQKNNRDDLRRKREVNEEEFLKKAWQVHEDTDAITDRVRYQAINWKIGDDVLSVFCDIEVTGRSQLAVTFNTDTSVATPSSEVNFTVRIDKNEPMTFKAYLYNDSYNSMYFKITGPQGRRLIDQMKTGEDVNIRVIKYNQSHRFNTTVKGATDAITEVVEKCS